MNTEELKKLLNGEGSTPKTDEEILKMFGSKKSETPKDTRYQYPYVELEQVMANPDEYIIPACQPACRALWDKNIETFMVSNNDDKDLYVLLANVSPENMAILKELAKSDPRYYFDEFRGTFGIAAKGMTDDSARELAALTEVFGIQDTVRYQSVEAFLESYKMTDGEMRIAEDGTIHRDPNPALANATIQEALEKTGKGHLYVAEEGRVYESPMYLKWHRRYQQNLQDTMMADISDITPYKGNVSGEIAHLRDAYLTAEREYVMELLKSEDMRELIEEINQNPPEVLFDMAQSIVDRVEMGQVPEDQMVRTEQQLTVLLAAIQDKVLMKDLVLTPSVGGRTR